MVGIMSITSYMCQGVYAIDCSSIDDTTPDNTPRIPACRLQHWLNTRKVTNNIIRFISVYSDICVSQISSAKSGVQSRKPSQYSQISGNHLSPPANMSWVQTMQLVGHDQHQTLEHRKEDIDLKSD